MDDFDYKAHFYYVGCLKKIIVSFFLCRKAMDDSDYEVHFDYFSIDFGEELSALYGGVLEQQADFAASCVEKILQLYSTNKKGGGKSAQEWV